MAAKRTLLRLQPLLVLQQQQHGALGSVRHFASCATRSDNWKFDEYLTPHPPSRSSSSGSPLASSSSTLPEKREPAASDTSLARSVFVRTVNGKHLISVVHTLSLLSQLASKFGPIQHFHFPRSPISQRLLGYGSVTFAEKGSLRKALTNDGIHTVVLPPIVPSRAPRSYLPNKEHEMLVGMGPLISCKAPSKQASASQTFLSSRSLQNPAAMRPGWNDVAPLCNMEAATQTSYFVDQKKAKDDTPEDAIIKHDSDFYLSTDPVPIEIKIERRTSPMVSRPGDRINGNPFLSSRLRAVRAALQQFGGFSNVITEKNLLRDSATEKRDTNTPSDTPRRPKQQPRSVGGGASDRRPSSRSSSSSTPFSRRSSRSFSTTSITHNAEIVKARRKAEWQRNRHSNFVDQIFLRVTGGKGGDGCVSFHREKFVQFGPPSGGNGGSGGSIYIRAVDGPTTLARISRRFRGADGPHGQGSFLHGRKAEDKYIDVPVGTVVTATRRLRIPEQEEAEEYYSDLLKRAAKANWDPTGVVAKEDVVLAAEEAERKRLARSRPPPPEIEYSDEASADGELEKTQEQDSEEEDIDGEDLLEPTIAHQLQILRDRVWRHYPRAEETNYRRTEFRTAEMRLALDRRRRRRYLAQSTAASTLSNSSSDQPSAASVTPYEDSEAPPPSEDREPWRIDLDEPTPPDSAGVLLAAGGRGGLGNPTFLSSTNRSPKFATRGEYGESLEITLELKRPSDIGLVGLPNAGKSTILRSISASKAQVGHWRFTTLSPNLGVVRLGSDGSVIGVDNTEVSEGYGADLLLSPEGGEGEEEFRLVLSDIPGLIDGAAANRGLGHTFLRHIERCSLLAYVLDLTEPEPWKDLKVLYNELAEYREDLPGKARLVIVNKADQFEKPEEIEMAKEKVDKIKRQAREIWQDQRALQKWDTGVKGEEGEPMKVVILSAKKKQGTQTLAKTLVELLRSRRANEQGVEEDENAATA